MAGLINVGIQRNIRTQLQQFIIDDIAEINLCLNEFDDYPGGAPIVIAENIYKARRLDRNIRNYPAVSIFSNEKSSKWEASRTTDNTHSCSIFCAVRYTDNNLVDDIMETLSECVEQILYKHPKFDFTIKEDGSDVVTGVYDSSPSGGIKYGSLDKGYIRAGQISWTGKVYVHQSQSYS